MGWIRDIIGQMRTPFVDRNRPSVAQKHLLKDKQGVGKNIYDNGIKNERAERHVRRWEAITYKWKYWFFKPAILVMERFLAKYHRKNNKWRNLKRNPHNENLVVFERAFDKAMEDWYADYFWPTAPVTYRGANGRLVKKVPRTQFVNDSMGKRSVRATKSISTRMLRAMRDSTISYALNDTVYREFVNILMYRIWMEMHNHHKDTLAKTADGKLVKQHLFYSSSLANDPHYFYLYHQVGTGRVQVRCTHNPVPLDRDKISPHAAPGEMPVMLDKESLTRANTALIDQLILEIQAEKQIRMTGVDPYKEKRIRVPEAPSGKK